jgi:hypothetical protein
MEPMATMDSRILIVTKYLKDISLVLYGKIRKRVRALSPTKLVGCTYTTDKGNVTCKRRMGVSSVLSVDVLIRSISASQR